MEIEKYRTINSAYSEIKKQDPESEISINGIKTGIRQGLIPSITIGNKVVVSIENILRFYSGRCVTAQDKTRNRSTSLARHFQNKFVDAIEVITNGLPIS